MKNYADAVGFYERLRLLGTNLGLGNVRQLLRLLGNPQNSLKFIHVAGTNGKGSTSAFLASILTHAGYRVGLYTSPHLTKFSDVIRIDGVEISDSDFVHYTQLVRKLIVQISDGQPTEFEVLTSMAFRYFADQKVDLVILETGLGGRGDATNVIANNELAVFTHIALDHQEFLGDRLELIAAEKAGILKPGSIALSTRQAPEAAEVIAAAAERADNRLLISDPETGVILRSTLDELVVAIDGVEYRSGLIGDHQRENLVLARNAALALREHRGMNISDEAIREGIAAVRWEGRLQRLSDSPLVFADGAHNLDSVETLIETLRAAAPGRKIVGIYATIRRPNIEAIVRRVLEACDNVILSEPRDRRAMPLSELEHLVIKQFDRIPLFSTTDYSEIVRYVRGREKQQASFSREEPPIYLAFGSLYFIRGLIPLFSQMPSDDDFPVGGAPSTDFLRRIMMDGRSGAMTFAYK